MLSNENDNYVNTNINSNLKHTIGSNDAQILISEEEPRNFLHVRLQRYFGQMFCGSNKLMNLSLLVCRVLFDVHFTPNAVSDDSDYSMQFRRFRYYRILNDILRTIITHNTLSFPRQRANFFRIAHHLNYIIVLT